MVLYVCPVRQCPSTYDRAKLLKNHLERSHGILLDKTLDAMSGRRVKKPRNAPNNRPQLHKSHNPIATAFRPFSNSQASAIDLRTPSLSPSVTPHRPGDHSRSTNIALSPDSSPEIQIQTPRQPIRSAPTWAFATPEPVSAPQALSELQTGADQRMESDADDESSTFAEQQDADDVMRDAENEKGDQGEDVVQGSRRTSTAKLPDSSTFFRSDSEASQSTTPDLTATLLANKYSVELPVERRINDHKGGGTETDELISESEDSNITKRRFSPANVTRTNAFEPFMRAATILLSPTETPQKRSIPSGVDPNAAANTRSPSSSSRVSQQIPTASASPPINNNRETLSSRTSTFAKQRDAVPHYLKQIHPPHTPTGRGSAIQHRPSCHRPTARSSMLAMPFTFDLDISNRGGGVSIEYAKARLEAIAEELLHLADSF